jgi:hypothetical protein
LGISLFECGRLADGRSHLETATNLLEHHRQQGMATRGDAGVTVPAWLAFILALQGYPDLARRTRDLSVKEANATKSLHSRAFGLAFATGTTCLLREFEELLPRAEALCALAIELDFPFMLAWGLAFRGIACSYLGGADGEQPTHDGLALYRQTGSKWALPFWLGCYVSAASQSEAKSAKLIREGLEAVDTTGERWFEAELYRLRGAFARLSPSSDAGRAWDDLCAAKRIAAQQGAKLLELRAAMSMARLWRDQGKREEARELLAPVYGWFTKGSTRAI